MLSRTWLKRTQCYKQSALFIHFSNSLRECWRTLVKLWCSVYQARPLIEESSLTSIRSNHMYLLNTAVELKSSCFSLIEEDINKRFTTSTITNIIYGQIVVVLSLYGTLEWTDAQELYSTFISSLLVGQALRCFPQGQKSYTAGFSDLNIYIEDCTSFSEQQKRVKKLYRFWTQIS